MSALAELVDQVATACPRRPAVRFPGGGLSYAELATQAARLAATLARPGGASRLAIIGQSPVEVAVAAVATSAAGVSLLLLDAAGQPAEHSRASFEFGAEAMLVGGQAQATAHDRPAPENLTPGLGMLTSGVSGLPKCVVRPWHSLVANTIAWGAALGLEPGQAVLCTTPPHHSYSATGGIITALSRGASYVGMGARPGPRAVAEALAEHRAEILLSVPLLYRWYAAGLAASHRPRLCVSAGAALPAEDRQRWERNVGWLLGEHYGNSEFGMLCVDVTGVPGSVGRPVAGVEVTVGGAGLEPDAVRVRLAGADSQFLTDGGTQLNRITGWYDTGDVGRLDDEGRLYLLGRRGMVVNRGGNKVSLAEIEQAVRRFAGVTECAVVAEDRPDGLPMLWAYVEGAVDLAGLRAQLAAQLASYKVPDGIFAVAALPRSSTGKVLAGQLPTSPPVAGGLS